MSEVLPLNNTLAEVNPIKMDFFNNNSSAFRIHSNIYSEAFLQKLLTVFRSYFHKKFHRRCSTGSECASEQWKQTKIKEV